MLLGTVAFKSMATLMCIISLTYVINNTSVYYTSRLFTCVKLHRNIHSNNCA